MIYCQSPTTLPNKKLGGFSSYPCGKCTLCLDKRRMEWTFRLIQENRDSISSYFITLTYDSLNLPLMCPDGTVRTLQEIPHVLFDSMEVTPTVFKRHIQLFMMRLRKKYPGSKIRYYIASEYGGNRNRPHYHALIFNIPLKNQYIHEQMKLRKVIFDAWTYGAVDIGKVENASIQYTAGYIMENQTIPKNALPNFSLMSLKPPIGHGYLKLSSRNKQLKTYEAIQQGEHKFLPRFYRDKIFTPGEKTAILKKLEKDSDTKIMERYTVVEKRGDDPFLDEYQQLKTKARTIINRTKNKKKL